MAKRNLASGKAFVFDLHTQKALGQHFLNDLPTIQKIAQMSNSFGECDSVLEIGPGSGALTQALLEQNKSVVAVEKDERAAQQLRLFASEKWNSKLSVECQDILKWKPTRLQTENVCMGNIPYYITSDIIFWYLDNIDSFKGAVFMVQNEVADRICAKPGNKDYGRLTVRLQLQCDAEKALFVPARMFSPPPKVDSAVVILRKKKDFVFANAQGELKSFEKFTTVLFSARRKMMRRVLAGALESKSPTEQGSFWEHAKEIGVTPEARPDTFAPETLVHLFQLLSRKH
jgi:16S rRNA (adenine1518-N6/adenine1519-N6)-dimethyltransferase